MCLLLSTLHVNSTISNWADTQYYNIANNKKDIKKVFFNDYYYFVRIVCMGVCLVGLFFFFFF